jgi:hypothetical protein
LYVNLYHDLQSHDNNESNLFRLIFVAGRHLFAAGNFAQMAEPAWEGADAEVEALAVFCC